MGQGQDVQAAAEAQQQKQKGSETFLTNEERKNVQRMLGFPEDIPIKFKSWLQDYLSVNFPEIPITQVSGFEKYLYKKGQQLPENPRDGQRYTYIVDQTNGIAWTFQYNASSDSTYKWEFQGGATIAVSAAGSVSTTANTFQDLGGPGSTVPLAGDYLVTWGCIYSNTTVGADMSMAVGGDTATIYFDLEPESPGRRVGVSKQAIVTGLSANATIKAFYKNATADGRTGSWQDRWVNISPQRVI